MKKTIMALGIALLAFQACRATAEFDKLKSLLDQTFKTLFDPAPDKFAFVTFKKDESALRKLSAFNTIIKNIGQFVTTNNKGLILGASTTLEQANKTLVDETLKLITTLGEIKNRLEARGNFADNLWDSQTGAQQLFIELGNLQDRVRQVRGVLRPKVDDYKSTGQKEAYALLMDALQDIYDGAAIIRYHFQEGGWLKKR